MSTILLKKVSNLTSGGAISPMSVFYGVDEFGNSVKYTGQQLIDLLLAPLSWKLPARIATAASISNLSSVTVADPDGQAQGVTLVEGDRILVKDGASPDGVAAVSNAYNGIYEVGPVVSGIAALSRPFDADTESELTSASIFILEGTVQDMAFVMITDPPLTLGTTLLDWAQFTGLGQITAGLGLTKVFNTIDVNPGNGIEIVSDAVEVKIDGTNLSKSATGLKIANGTAGQLMLANASGVGAFATISGDITSITGLGAVTLISSTESVQGKIQIASQALVDAGVDDTRAITSLKLKSTTFALTQIVSPTANVTYRSDGTSPVENPNLKAYATGLVEVGQVSTSGSIVIKRASDGNNTIELLGVSGNVRLGRAGQTGTLTLIDSSGFILDLTNGGAAGILSIGSSYVAPTANQHAAPKQYVDDEIEAQIPDGTISNTTTRWSGTAWVENPVLRAYTTGLVEVGQSATNGSLVIKRASDGNNTIELLGSSGTINVGRIGQTGTITLKDTSGFATNLTNGGSTGTVSIGSSYVAPTLDQHAAPKKYVDDEIQAQVPDGTVANSTLRWSGTAWVQNTNVKTYTTGLSEFGQSGTNGSIVIKRASDGNNTIELLGASGQVKAGRTGQAGRFTIVDASGFTVDLYNGGATGVLAIGSSYTAPTADNHAAPKAYVDGLLAGLAWKASIRWGSDASIADLSSVTVADPDGQAQGVTLVEGDRVLVKDGASPDGVAAVSDAYNGIYVVGTVTAGSAPLTRTTDADTAAELENAAAFVGEGVNQDNAYVMITDPPITVDTTLLTWTQFNGLGQIIAGLGLTKTGNTLDVNAGNGIEIVSDAVEVKIDGTNLSKSASGLKITNGTAGQVMIADASGVAAFTTLSGDITAITGAGAVTIISATESVPGKIEIATQAEVDAGTDDTRAVTPAKLANSTLGWTKYTVSHTTLQAAATSNSSTLFSLAANEMLEHVVIKHSTAFAGTGITAYTIEIGISGDEDKYASAFDVFQVVADSAKQVSTSPDIESFSGSTNILITARSTGANLDQSTAGSVDVWIKRSKLP